jgi:hypothetical protein
MSGNRIDVSGSLIPLQINDVTKRWARLKQSYHTNFSSSPEESVAWHEREAKSCESDWDWWAATFHLRQLLEAKPGDKTLAARFAYAQMALAQETRMAGTNRAQVRAIPPRDPLATSSQIDLSSFYNGSFREANGTTIEISDAPIDFPLGLQTFDDGVRFDVRGLIQLTGQAGRDRSAQVLGIKVGQACRRLHFLHATRNRAIDGKQVGSYIIHFADAQQIEVPIVYGRDVRAWRMEAGTREVIGAEKSVVAWMGTSLAAKARVEVLRIFRFTWEPLEPRQIISIDFVSNASDAEPFLAALTVE